MASLEMLSGRSKKEYAKEAQAVAVGRWGLDIPAWVIRGDPAEGGLIADEHVTAVAERVGSDHVITIAGAGIRSSAHIPKRRSWRSCGRLPEPLSGLAERWV